MAPRFITLSNVGKERKSGVRAGFRDASVRTSGQQEKSKKLGKAPHGRHPNTLATLAKNHEKQAALRKASPFKESEE